jgi:hypothetical protein
VSLPPDAAVQEQPQAAIGEVAEAVSDALDLLIGNGAVKWGAAGEHLLVFGWCVGFEVAGGRWLGRGRPGPRRSVVDRRTARLIFAGRDRKSEDLGQPSSVVGRHWPQVHDLAVQVHGCERSRTT